MKVERMTCVKTFTDNSKTYKEGDIVLVLPELETDTHYAVASDYLKPFMINKENLVLANNIVMHGYYYKAGKSYEDVKLWEATKNNTKKDINVESFLKQDNYWNIRSFIELAKEIQLVLKADYSYPIILDEEYKLVDGAHRLIHAYIDGKTHIKGVIIRNEQLPEPDYDELKKLKG